MAKGKKYGGRIAGVPNKVTADARTAIAKFVNDNAHRLQSWLDVIANGKPEVDEAGDPIPGKYAVKPDPAHAFELFQSVIEYHVPKLARSEHVGDGGGPVKHEVHIVDPTRRPNDSTAA
jgi:hypothetical protein